MKNDRINGKNFENSCKLPISKNDVIVYTNADVGRVESEIVVACSNDSSIKIVDSVFFKDRYLIFHETNEKRM